MDAAYSGKIENLRNIMANCDEIFRKTFMGDEENRTHVVCHGDFLRNNLLFRYENGIPTDLKLVDLANSRFASPVIDVALALYINADQKMRDENWENLIDEYYGAVQNTFSSTKVPSKSSILEEFKTNSMNAYFVASIFLPSLVADDNDDMPKMADLVPEEYKNALTTEIPIQIVKEMAESKEEGGSKATAALVNILKDIIDRGFV